MENKLKTNWNLYFHDLNSEDWTLSAYDKLITIETIEDYHIVFNNIKDWNDGLYYLMREGYPPIWEDKVNKDGGGWTFKILKNNINKFWTDITSYCIGETIMNMNMNDNSITGISLSPKYKYTTVRIWSNDSTGNITKFITDKNINIDFKETLFTLNK